MISAEHKDLISSESWHSQTSQKLYKKELKTVAHKQIGQSLAALKTLTVHKKKIQTGNVIMLCHYIDEASTSHLGCSYDYSTKKVHSRTRSGLYINYTM